MVISLAWEFGLKAVIEVVIGWTEGMDGMTLGVSKRVKKNRNPQRGVQRAERGRQSGKCCPTVLFIRVYTCMFSVLMCAGGVKFLFHRTDFPCDKIT